MWRTSRLGWIPSKPDHRDLKYKDVGLKAELLPASVDLTALCPPVYDQGELGSCTANAIAGAIDYCRKKNGLPLIYPSRLAIYYGERAIEGTVPEDAGAEIRDGIKLVRAQGAGAESLWPYDPAKFTIHPPPPYYHSSHQDVVVGYSSLNNTDINELKGCLAVGDPFVFGMVVFQEMESEEVAQTGDVPMPGPGDEPIGGHAILAVGYNDAAKKFLVRNSWGANWGKRGYFTLPYNYMTNPQLVSDLWHISSIGYNKD